MSKTFSRPNLRFEFLDGIRGWASIMVLLSHIVGEFLGRSTESYRGLYLAFITDARLAIYIFFVLSGFVLSIKFVKNDNLTPLAASVVSRYFRLLIPVLFTSFIAYCLMKTNLMFNTRAGSLANSTDWLGTFYNFQPALKNLLAFSFYDVFFNYNGTKTYNAVLWTMSVEFAGSMLIYIIIGVFRQSSRKIFFVPLMAILLFFLINKPALACFVLGYFLAEAYINYAHILEKAKFTNAISTLLFVLSVLLSTFYKPAYFQVTAIQVAVLILSITFSSSLKYFFSSSVSKFLGRVSFPLYLMHLIVICSLSSYLFIKLPLYGYMHQTVANIVFFATIIASLFCAWIIYPIEVFSIRTAKYLSEKILSVSIEI